MMVAEGRSERSGEYSWSRSGRGWDVDLERGGARRRRAECDDEEIGRTAAAAAAGEENFVVLWLLSLLTLLLLIFLPAATGMAVVVGDGTEWWWLLWFSMREGLWVRSCCFILSFRVKALLQVGQWIFFSPVCFFPCRAACPEVVKVSRHAYRVACGQGYFFFGGFGPVGVFVAVVGDETEGCGEATLAMAAATAEDGDDESGRVVGGEESDARTATSAAELV